jgi:hypothetical protein
MLLLASKEGDEASHQGLAGETEVSDIAIRDEVQVLLHTQEASLFLHVPHVHVLQVL